MVYEQVNVDDVVEQLTHLSESQRDNICAVLKKFTELFDGTLGVYPHRKLCWMQNQSMFGPTQ